MSEDSTPNPASTLNRLRDAQTRMWREGRRIAIEDLVSDEGNFADEELVELLINEFLLRQELADPQASPENYLSQYPEFDALLRAAFQRVSAESNSSPAMADETTPLSESVGDELVDETIQVGPRTRNSDAEEPIPERIGRYRIIDLLGRGGFGAVYRGYDDHLDREIAIKTPRADRPQPAEQLDASFAEAKAAAALDHANIVPVYDVGQTEDGSLFIVSKLIDGQSLKSQLEAGCPDWRSSVQLAAQIADALHSAHLKGLVHRDVKPDNILLDAAGEPYVVDFGLALRDDDIGRGSRWSGTPAYMSPEQASGEGHRVDGRSDIHSLGVVLYEMLSGRRPFRSNNITELSEQIREQTPKPIRQINDEVPLAVEQACLKALAKDPVDRYSSAKDFADELRLAMRAVSDTAPAAADQHANAPLPTKPISRVVVALGVVGVLCIAALALPFMLPSGEKTADDVERDVLTNHNAGETGSARVAPATRPTIGQREPSIQVVRFDVQVRRGEGGFEPIESAQLPLVNGDLIRFDIELSEPGFARLLWMDAEGAVTELYPNDPETGDRGKSAAFRFGSPADPNSGWPMEGEAGRECAVLLVAREAVPPVPSPPVSPLPAKGASLLRLGAVKLQPQIATTRSLGAKSVAVSEELSAWHDELKEIADDVSIVGILHANR